MAGKHRIDQRNGAPGEPQVLPTATALFNMRVASAREMLMEGFSQREVIAIHGSCVLRYVLETWNSRKANE